MRLQIILITFLLPSLLAVAQRKPRPDAFPPEESTSATKSTITMATTLEEMAAWDRYPTYDTYLAMMQHWAETYPDLCTVDTIGTSLRGRLILAMHISGEWRAESGERPQFFYSSTIHGDEVTGYVMMLRLIDTLLSSYGTDARLTTLVNDADLYINPLANPDGTYWRGDNTVRGAQRYNADGIDLNRAYPDPFAVATNGSKAALPQENQAMMDYVAAHRFRLSANLHGGSEVLNFPWDSFTSSAMPHPQSPWWEATCRQLVDTLRAHSRSHFRDVTDSGFIAGGDWYVIRGGRQDYMNYYHNCLELTMEVSSAKTPDSDELPSYWNLLAPMLISYIEHIHSLPEGVGIREMENRKWKMEIYPNPASDKVTVTGLPEGSTIELYDATGRLILSTLHSPLSLSNLPSGLYLLRAGGQTMRLILKN